MTKDIREIAKMETKCTGCGACVNVCPRGAIRLIERDGYFLFPEIDETKCSHCGLCLKKCPSAGTRPEPSNVTDEVAYGCYVKDEVERARSSSGGFFQLLAKWVLQQSGAVCGARFTKGCLVEHVIIEKVEDLPPLQRSKYVQSNPGFVYAELKRRVAAGQLCLFVGTPCQVAACKSVVGESDRLITVDFMCHGVPPQKLLHEHLELLTGEKTDTIENLRFRDKNDEGWNLSHIKFDFEGGHYNSRQIDDLYFKAFAENMSIRRSCGDCRHARFPRVGDFTLGDMWTIAETDLKLRDNKGVSALIVNTEVASKIFSSLKSEFATCKKVDISRISAYNNLQVHSCMHPHAVRFHKALSDRNRTQNVHELIDGYLKRDDGVCILNFHDGHSNYGSVLTGFALKEKIRKLSGIEPVHMHLWDVDGGDPISGDLVDFNREYLPATELIRGRGQLDRLNKYFRTFIVGPDVVWRNSGYTQDFNLFLFNFVRFSKNICSYAASFGYSSLKNLLGENAQPFSPAATEIAERKRLMKRFSHVSVREDSGVGICKENFDVDAEHVLDSVFFLSAADYSALIGPSDACREFNARYVLNPSYTHPDLISKLRCDETFISLRDAEGDYADRYANGVQKVSGKNVLDWLRLIRDCKLFVTDSFHGVCFAIIFRRQFVVLNPSKTAGTERVDSLLRMFGIPRDRYAYTVSDYEYIVANPLDYSKIEPKLNEWIAKSEDYLKRVLADNKPNKTRDWLESIEMLIESRCPTVARRDSRIRFIAARLYGGLKRKGLIRDSTHCGVRCLQLRGFPFAMLRYEKSGICLYVCGIKLKTLHR